jgi:hypothetical protein
MHPVRAGFATFLRLIADLGRMPQGDEEKMFALNIGQHQSASDTFQHLSRGQAAASLLKPGVPLNHEETPEFGRGKALKTLCNVA